MTAVARLRLDTSPPSLTWGPPGYAVAGEDFTIPYLLDEGVVTRAEIVFNGGTVYELQFDDNRVFGHFPDDAHDGPAMLRAYVVDDVGNTAVAERQIEVSGFVRLPPITARPAGGVPHAPDRLRSHSSAEVSSRSRVRARSRTSSTTTVAVWHRIRYRVLASRPAALVDIEWHVSAVQPLRTAAQVASRESVARVMEGPAYEEELILLGVF